MPTGKSRKAKDHAKSADALRIAFESRPEAAATKKALRELMTAMGRRRVRHGPHHTSAGRASRSTCRTSSASRGRSSDPDTDRHIVVTPRSVVIKPRRHVALRFANRAITGTFGS